MQAYGPGFARVYNLKWSNFARQTAPLILNFYENTTVGKASKSVLDLCCGAGHLAVHLLEKGYNVVGIDLSEHMLHYAEENASRFIESGQCRFILADATDFTLNEKYDLVVSTYDSLNHLENELALKDCFRCVHAVCDGYFIFDLNTLKGLRRWNGIHLDDSGEDSLILSRGIYDEQGETAWLRITGFVHNHDGLYERFDETVYNTVFNMERVKDALLDIGWQSVHFTRINDLSTQLENPEEESRVFVIASK